MKRSTEGFGGGMHRLLLAACLLFNLSGCSVFMAAQLPDKKNLEVFKPGVPRQVVLAEMGLPSGYENRSGIRSDWAFTGAEHGPRSRRSKTPVCISASSSRCRKPCSWRLTRCEAPACMDGDLVGCRDILDLLN
jgi:hypothetical protein